MSTKLVTLQQQVPQYSVLPIGGDPWQFWTPSQISYATTCPVDNVISDWPVIYQACVSYGVGDFNPLRAVLGTIAVETAHTFKPVREAFWLDEAWRAANLRYYPYYGRGYIQLTWDYNYIYYGNKIGVQLVSQPDLAMVPAYAARVMALYFLERGVASAARIHDWPECRRLVQGAHAGLPEFEWCVNQLERPHGFLSDVLARGRSRIGIDPYVWDGEQPGGFDCSGFVKWCYNGDVPSYTDDIYDVGVATLYPRAGDPVLYKYYDPRQPNTRYPHVGLYLDEDTTLDARDGYTVGIRPHIRNAELVYVQIPGYV